MAKPRPGTTVAVILFATLGTCAAHADDAIRPGKWAFSAVVSEATAPPGAEFGYFPGGIKAFENYTSKTQFGEYREADKRP